MDYFYEPAPQEHHFYIDKEQQERPIVLKTQKVSSKVDEKAFQEYLLSHPDISSQNKDVLLKTTLTAPLHDLQNEITYHNVLFSKHGLDRVLSGVIQSQPRFPKSVRQFFDYNDVNHYYVDYANAVTFGGNYRTHGNVQEERMFAEFPILPLLDFITNNGIHPIEIEKENEIPIYPPKAKASPFIIESIYRQFDITKVPYGRIFENLDLDGLIHGVNQGPLNIIGLAAIDWRFMDGRKYEMEHLQYHFEAAFLAFNGARMVSEKNGWKETVIHTGSWGCGVFDNSEKMMTAIQYLAARIADVDLVFHAVGLGFNKNYEESDIKDVINFVEGLIEKQNSPQQILQILLLKSFEDESWAPHPLRNIQALNNAESQA